MKRPNERLIKLIKIGRIHGIHLRQVQTGTDTAETHCKIAGDSGKAEGRWSLYEEYLDVRPFFDGIAAIKSAHMEAYRQWVAFEKKNAKELAEYERLKAKFEK